MTDIIKMMKNKWKREKDENDENMVGNDELNVKPMKRRKMNTQIEVSKTISQENDFKQISSQKSENTDQNGTQNQENSPIFQENGLKIQNLNDVQNKIGGIMPPISVSFGCGPPNITMGGCSPNPLIVTPKTVTPLT